MNNLRRRLIKELDEGVEAGRCPHCNSKGAFLNGRVKCPKCGREIDEVAEKARDTKTTVEIPAPLVKSFNPSTAPASFIASLARRAAEQGLNGDEPLSFEIPAAVRKAIDANRSGFMAMVKQFKDAAEIKTPESMKKSGTTPGAIKGWRTRHRGMAESDLSGDNIASHLDMIENGKILPNAQKIAQVLDPSFDFGEEDSRSFTHQELSALETKLGITLNDHDRIPFRYSGYSSAERKLSLINKLMDGYGVEYVDDQNKGQNVGRYSESSAAAMYVNTGDTYSPTVLYDVDAGKFRLTSWGDFVENDMKESGDGYTRKPVRSRKSLLAKSMDAMQKYGTSAGVKASWEKRRRTAQLEPVVNMARLRANADKRGLTPEQRAEAIAEAERINAAHVKPTEGEGRQTPAQEGEGRQAGFRQDNRPDTSKILSGQSLLDEAGEKKQVRQWAKEPLSRLRRRQETNQTLLRRNAEEHKATTDPEHKQRLEEAGKKLDQIDRMLTAAVDRREFGRRR